jgi:hypothetical protein
MISHFYDGDICERCGAQGGIDPEGCEEITPALRALRQGELSLVAYDTETHLIQPGLLAPPLVIGSVATSEPGSERVLSKDEARQTFRSILENPKAVIGGANLPYDLGVHAADEQRNGQTGDVSLVELIFQALEEGRAVDTHILEPLHDNARGLMFREANGAPFNRYSLAMLETRYLGIDRSAEKTNGWRLKYALLDGKPLSEFPEEAIGYPRRDARGTFDVLARQLGADRHNLQCNTLEMRAAWFLHLACMWGMRTDPVMVEQVVGEITRKHEESRRRFFDVGIVRVRPCTKKAGEFEEADDIPMEWLEERRKALCERIGIADKTVILAEVQKTLPPDQQWIPERLADIEVVKRALAKGRPIRFAEDKGRLKELVEAAYQGEPPMTSGGASGNQQVSTSRDTLVESGDELLEEYGEAGPNEKLFAAFTGVLLQGTQVPINPSANVLVTSGRTSYRNPNLQQLPRKGGIRECFVPRQGWVYSSVDYASLELCTLSDFCLQVFGYSRMADAINAKQDLHCRMAARVLGMTYDQVMADIKDKRIADTRQSMKPVNYGLGGKMGAPKLVLTARKDGIRFCELAGVSADCSKNERTTRWGQATISPTCVECLHLAAKYKNLWYEEWPEMHDYHALTDEITAGCDAGDPLESIGEGMLRLETNPNAVANHFFQNPASQGAKHAGWLIAKEAHANRRSPLFNNFHTVVFVHDETLAEIREEVLHECAFRQAELMVQGMQRYVKRVQITAEPAAMRRWFKGTDKLFTKAGRLKPWWPVGKGCNPLEGKHAKVDCACWKWAPDQAQMMADLAA